jgi:hypothetical protein
MSGGKSGVQAGPGSGQLVNQRTEELSAAVREKWGQALMGLGSFGNRTKELAETAKNQIGDSASSAGKAIGETSSGECARIISCMLFFLTPENVCTKYPDNKQTISIIRLIKAYGGD